MSICIDVEIRNLSPGHDYEAVGIPSKWVLLYLSVIGVSVI